MCTGLERGKCPSTRMELCVPILRVPICSTWNSVEHCPFSQYRDVGCPISVVGNNKCSLSSSPILYLRPHNWVRTLSARQKLAGIPTRMCGASECQAILALACASISDIFQSKFGPQSIGLTIAFVIWCSRCSNMNFSMEHRGKNECLYLCWIF